MVEVRAAELCKLVLLFNSISSVQRRCLKWDLCGDVHIKNVSADAAVLPVSAFLLLTIR